MIATHYVPIITLLFFQKHLVELGHRFKMA
jgi:hypothetical protein